MLNQMVEDSLTLVLGAVADPTRRSIVRRLSIAEATVGELAEPFAMSMAAVSKHIHVLERAGLLEQRREGRLRHCRLVASPLRQLDAWLGDYRGFWDQRLDALADHFADKEE
jgi:DNA-binding transcriptional ArsR family regulator